METYTLTGFPGFISEYVLRESLSDSSKDIHWNLIVLSSQKAIAEAKLRAMGLRSYSILSGDICLSELGLKSDELASVRAHTTVFFHLAAIYDLSAGLRKSRLINVIGTQNVFLLAKSCQKLTKMNYISTCFVAGRRQGVIEEDSLSDEAGFHNHYERTKFEAEVFVQGQKWPFHVAIFRPSIVVGHSETGETSKFDGPLVVIRFFRQWKWLLRHMLAFPNLGFKDSWVNTIPVDIVARTLWRGGRDPNVSGVFHVATPDVPSTESFFPYLIWHALKLKNFYPSLWLSRFLLHILKVFPAPLLTGLPSEIIAYFFYRGRFETKRFESLAHSKGIRIPSYETYYGKLIEFARKNRRPCPHDKLFIWQQRFSFVLLLVAISWSLVTMRSIRLPVHFNIEEVFQGTMIALLAVLAIWSAISPRNLLFHRWGWIGFVFLAFLFFFLGLSYVSVLGVVAMVFQMLLSYRVRETVIS